jgi:hypothetical protein
VDEPNASGPALRRDLGTLESYAVLVGILIGAGIFKVTSDATVATGPSVILAHLVLAPVVLATSVAYLVFLSTPLGLQPGGEILHIARTLSSRRLTFISAWLKLISYMGAGAYLADALALNVLELCAPGEEHGAVATRLLALAASSLPGAPRGGALVQASVAMCASSGIARDPDRPWAVRSRHVQLPALLHPRRIRLSRRVPPMFFAYAGFEALAQAAGEVRDSRCPSAPRLRAPILPATSGDLPLRDFESSRSASSGRSSWERAASRCRGRPRPTSRSEPRRS